MKYLKLWLCPLALLHNNPLQNLESYKNQYFFFVYNSVCQLFGQGSTGWFCSSSVGHSGSHSCLEALLGLDDLRLPCFYVWRSVLVVSGTPCLQQASTGLSMWEGCPKSKAQCATTFQTLFAPEMLLPHGQSKPCIKCRTNTRGIPEPKPSIWHISSRFTSASLAHCMLPPCPLSSLFHFCSALRFWLLFW